MIIVIFCYLRREVFFSASGKSPQFASAYSTALFGTDMYPPFLNPLAVNKEDRKRNGYLWKLGRPKKWNGYLWKVQNSSPESAHSESAHNK